MGIRIRQDHGIYAKLVEMSEPSISLWSVSLPSRDDVVAFLETQRDQGFSYREVQQTRGAPPRGYDYDDNHIELGAGEDDFHRACVGLRSWRMFPEQWTRVTLANDESVAEGVTLSVQARAFGLWWTNANRIVYMVDDDKPVRRWGFAYGTLPAHVEQGEELFTIEQWADGTVWYRVQSFSRPKYSLVKWAKPLARMVQRKFVRDSQAAMRAWMRR